MSVSSRGIVAVGLGMLGVAVLVGPSLGQQEGTPRAGSPAAQAAQTAQVSPPAPVAPVIGTVDVEQVFRSYEKVKATNQEFSAAMMARKNDLMKIMTEAQHEAELLAKLEPGSDDYKQHENRVTELKAKHEASREQAEREFSLKQSELMATIYKEIQQMVAKIAVWRKMNYVVKVSNQPITGTDPQTVMNAISSAVVYADTRNDITNDVIYNLNRFYKASTVPSTGARPAAGGSDGQPATGARGAK